MSKSLVELAQVGVFETIRAAELRTVDTLQIVGRLPRSAYQETAAIIDSARDERMNDCSDRVIIQRTLDAA